MLGFLFPWPTVLTAPVFPVLPDWNGPRTSVACMIVPDCAAAATGAGALVLLFNPRQQASEFLLPAASDGGAWHVAVDTDAPSPRDIPEDGAEPRIEAQDRHRVSARSLVVLVRKGRR